VDVERRRRSGNGRQHLRWPGRSRNRWRRGEHRAPRWGNTFKGTVFANYAGESWASDNYKGDLKTNFPNLKVNTIQKVYDFNPMFGGPILKDRLWFFATSRTVGANNYVAGMFVNRNAGTAAFVPDLDKSRQAVTDNRYITGTIRLTAQATSKHKFAVYWDDQDRCVTCTGGGRQRRPLKRPAGAMPFRARSARSPGSRRSRAGCCSKPDTASTTSGGAAVRVRMVRSMPR
jgi:hypothetical protein